MVSLFQIIVVVLIIETNATYICSTSLTVVQN